MIQKHCKLILIAAERENTEHNNVRLSRSVQRSSKGNKRHER